MVTLSSIIQGHKECPAYSNTLGVLQRHQKVAVTPRYV